MTARPCFVTREWAPWTRGGIGEGIRGLIERSTVGAIVLWDQPLRIVAAARDTLDARVSVFAVEELCAERLPVHVFRSEAYWRSHRVWRALDRLLEMEAVESVEFPDYDGLGFVSIKAARLGLGPRRPPLRVRIHGTVERTARGDGQFLLSLADKQRARMERYALRHADRVIAPSSGLLAAYREDYRLSDDVAVDPLPVTLPSSLADRGYANPPSSLPLRIGFLGKLQPIKGADVLVRAVCARLAADPEREIEVHLVGADERGRFGPSHLEELRRLIPAGVVESFHFHGALPREEAFLRLASCHAAVCASRSETFGLAARELIALGLPLAATSIPAFRDDLGKDAGYIEFFEVDAIDGLAEIIDRWAQSLEAGVWPPVVQDAGGDAKGRGSAQAALAPDAHSDESSTREPVSTIVVRPEPESEPAPGTKPRRRDGAPRVSIVIPFFEMQDYVEACLDSIELCGYSDLEIVFVDDGSTTEAARHAVDAIRRRFEGDPMRQVVVKSNGGLGSARNAGIERATGEFVLPLDPDDLLVAGYLEAAVCALDRVDDLAFVVGISSLFRDGDNPARERDWIVPYDPDRGMLFYENGAGTAAAVFRRAHLLRFPYREDLPAYEDWDLHLQLATAGLEGESLPIVTHRYRQRRAGLGQLARRNHDRLLAALLEPHLANVDPDLRTALEIYLASVTRMRGLESPDSAGRRRLVEWVEAFYRRRLKTWLSDRLGEARRDRIAAKTRKWLRGR